MPNELDFPTAIGQLAEATGPCGGCNGNALVPRLKFWDYFETLPKGEVSSLCPDCDGTGRIPLFPSLRVQQQGRWSHSDCTALGRCDLTVLSALVIRDCEGRGWVPVSDPQVACWILTRWLAECGCSLWRRPDGTWGVDWDMGKTIAEGATAEEAVICAALARVKEQP